MDIVADDRNVMQNAVLSIINIDFDYIVDEEKGLRFIDYLNSQFLEEITEIIGKIDLNKNEIFYRGHSKISYEIEPSVLRKNNGTPLYLQNENKIFSELLVSNSEEFISDKTTFDKLVRMLPSSGSEYL